MPSVLIKGAQNSRHARGRAYTLAALSLITSTKHNHQHRQGFKAHTPHTHTHTIASHCVHVPSASQMEWTSDERENTVIPFEHESTQSFLNISTFKDTGLSRQTLHSMCQSEGGGGRGDCSSATSKRSQTESSTGLLYSTVYNSRSQKSVSVEIPPLRSPCQIDG